MLKPQDHFFSGFDDAIAERAAAMQARVVECEELIAEAKHRDVTATDRHHLAAALVEIADPANGLEVRQ